jgi:hypothetical protein
MTKEELEATVYQDVDQAGNHEDYVLFSDALAYGASEREAGLVAGLEIAHELIDHLGSRGLVAAEIARRRAEQGEQTDATA